MNFDDYRNTFEPIYAEFSTVVSALLANAMTAQSELVPRPQSMQTRAKSGASLKRKLENRALLHSVQIETEIKDLAGVRVILYTNTDVDRFLNSRVIPETFEVDWKETRAHHPNPENDQRRYQAFHYTVLLKDELTQQPAYEKFKGMRCEVQIQTILNHAWAETHHDMIYQAQDVEGFGSKAREALDRRMKKIMDDHLRPAGYELDKVQHDHERLMQGKALFDRGALESLAKCDNNNDRHAILTTLVEHVIPNYDDIAAVYPEIRRAVIAAVQAARATEPQVITTAFGDLPGQTADQITSLAVRILSELRYVDVVGTLNSLVAIYKEEPSEERRKDIVQAADRMAQYNLNVWKQAGPYIQVLLADAAETFPPAEIDAARSVFLAVWRELLGSGLRGTTWSADAVIISSGAVSDSEEVRAVRQKAITGLTTLFDRAASEQAKIDAVTALRHATSLPSQAAYSNEMCALVLDNTTQIAELLTARAGDLSYELRRHIENRMLHDYQRSAQIAADEQNRFGCRENAKGVMSAVSAFRDLINADLEYVRYKTFVGYDSVFTPHWDDNGFDYARVDAYRKRKVAEYIAEVSDANAGEWYATISRCAKAKNSDQCTFPVFIEFIQALAEARPTIVLGYIERLDPDVLNFLSAMLVGLAKSSARDEYAALIANYIAQGKHVAVIARHCRALGSGEADRVKTVLARAVEIDERIAIMECLIFGIECHDAEQRPLIDSVFVPALQHLTEKHDARWVRGAWYLTQANMFFPRLSPANTEIVLNNLLFIKEIDHEVERILTLLAQNHASLVWQHFSRRLQKAQTEPDGYEAIPYDFHGLEQALAKDAALAVKAIRETYRHDDELFQFTGGRLLHAVFPTFTEALSAELGRIAADGSSDNIDFTLHVLRNYHGEMATHDVIKQLIEFLPEDKKRLGTIDICLSDAGIVSGEFGMVEAYRRKKAEMASWADDPRERVRNFAEGYIRRLDQRIASEQRRAEQQKELRRRDFDEQDA